MYSSSPFLARGGPVGTLSGGAELGQIEASIRVQTAVVGGRGEHGVGVVGCRQLATGQQPGHVRQARFQQVGGDLAHYRLLCHPRPAGARAPTNARRMIGRRASLRMVSCRGVGCRHSSASSNNVRARSYQENRFCGKIRAQLRGLRSSAHNPLKIQQFLGGSGRLYRRPLMGPFVWFRLPR